MSSQVCKRCELTKPLTRFEKEPRNRSGYLSTCLDCRAAWRREWRAGRSEITKAQAKQHKAALRERGGIRDYARRRVAADPEAARLKRQKYHRLWRERYPEKARLQDAIKKARKRNAPGRCTAAQLAARIAYYGGGCYVCDAPWEHIDHVIPLAKGGSNWPANLRPMCAEHNQSKHARPLAVFLAQIDDPDV